MRMMAMGAAIGAFLMSAAPAAAQKADPSAVCLIAVTDILTKAEARPEQVTEDMKPVVQSFRNALHFHVGVLHARYSEAQLGPVMSAGVAEFRAMPSGTVNDFTVKCMQEERPVLTAMAEALKGQR